MESKRKFKPFDKVLVRDDDYGTWIPDFYQFFNEEVGKHLSMLKDYWLDDFEIIPYEGNEHLVGTTGEPEEEVRLEKGEWIMCFLYISGLPFSYCLRKFHSIGDKEIKAQDDNLLSVWPYCIKFSDFDPNDMEETKKHILCVKNGKIMRYNN